MTAARASDTAGGVGHTEGERDEGGVGSLPDSPWDVPSHDWLDAAAELDSRIKFTCEDIDEGETRVYVVKTERRRDLEGEDDG